MARAPAVQEIEEFPEADRLEGFPHPRETLQLFGHGAAERTLAEAFAGGRPHHAWLITGRIGIGKTTLAYRAARHLLANPEDRDVFGLSLSVPDAKPASRQVRALSHPGLLVIRRPYDQKARRMAASIPVDEVRRLRSFLAHSADAGRWRAVIVDTADELNVNAANALLKSLEEPPPRTVFLLVSSEPGALLATIRSRCRLLALQPLAAGALRKAAAAALEASGGEAPRSEAEWDRLERLAEGSVRRLLGLHAAGGLQLYDRILKLVTMLPKVDWSAVHLLADELGSTAAEQRFELFFELLLDLIARLVRAEAGGEGYEGEMQLARRLMGDGRLATFAELWETVTRERALTLALNLDRKTLILETFFGLEAAAKPSRF